MSFEKYGTATLSVSLLSTATRPWTVRLAILIVALMELLSLHWWHLYTVDDCVFDIHE